MRRPNTRPTVIYWLVDVRPGRHATPFYCGKTVDPKQRLRRHLKSAEKPGRLQRDLYFRIMVCGNYIEMRVMEIVPHTEDWCVRERHWIAIIRHCFRAVNATDGGAGMPGIVMSQEAVAKSAAAKRGKPRSSETRAKLRAANLGKKQSPETIEKRASSLRGQKLSPERAANLRAANLGKKHSPETIEKIRTREIGPEWRARMSSSHTGKRHSPETLAKMRAAQQQRRNNERNMSAVHG